MDRVTDLTAVPDSAEFMHSVVVGSPNGVPEPPPIESETGVFLKVRKDVRARKWPGWFFEDLGIDPAPPPMFARHGVNHKSPAGAVRLVDHAMDHRLDLHRAFVDAVGGVPTLKADRSPPASGVDFLGLVQFDGFVAASIAAALVAAFETKSWFVRVRPEHFFESGELVAEYQCPPHHSYVAGHSAIAGATVQAWIDNVELEDVGPFITAGQQYGHYRTLAGVHWPADNAAGFDLGRAIVSEGNTKCNRSCL